MKAYCPTSSAHKKFVTTCRVIEEWLVDENGHYLDSRGVIDSDNPDPRNLWTCVDCGETAHID